VRSPLSSSARRNGAGTGVDAAAHNTASNSWSAAPAPPPLGAGQAIKSGAGLFGATDGTSTWLFAINTNAANSILYTTHNGTADGGTAVPGTDTGTHARRFISAARSSRPGRSG
jgi:hypothetical protein